jgi:hypothetical protein
MKQKAKFLVWLLGGFALLIWSSVMWAAHWAIGFGGNLAAMNADKIPGSPEWVEWLSSAARLFAGFGQWAVLGLWLVTSLIILWAMRFVGRFLESCQMSEKSESENASTVDG